MSGKVVALRGGIEIDEVTTIRHPATYDHEISLELTRGQLMMLAALVREQIGEPGSGNAEGRAAAIDLYERLDQAAQR